MSINSLCPNQVYLSNQHDAPERHTSRMRMHQNIRNLERIPEISWPKTPENETEYQEPK